MVACTGYFPCGWCALCHRSTKKELTPEQEEFIKDCIILLDKKKR